MVLGFTALLLAVSFLILALNPRGNCKRASGAVGLLALVPLFLLGAMWPSLFTIAALLALPAVVILVLTIARPTTLSQPALRLYTIVAVFVSPAFWLLWLQKIR